ncbi:MAG: HEPN domain-containing protein [Pseudobutyrivibrio sp.]|nr:HEPN domain-containing protein [Pseudobutyrivibrio sp.]
MEQLNDFGTKEDLCIYRIEVAKKDLISAKTLLSIEDYRGANNRAYYSIFHAINAVHALDGQSYKKHKDAIANFNKNYIKTEIFDKSLGRRINEAEKIRHASDYDDFYIANISEAKEQIEIADNFLKEVEKYCKSRINE